MRFTVEIKDINRPEKCQVQMYLDSEGIDDLMKQLSFLKSSGDHAHFFTPSWGGAPLTETKNVEDNTLVHHLEIIHV